MKETAGQRGVATGGQSGREVSTVELDRAVVQQYTAACSSSRSIRDVHGHGVLLNRRTGRAASCIDGIIMILTNKLINTCINCSAVLTVCDIKFNNCAFLRCIVFYV